MVMEEKQTLSVAWRSFLHWTDKGGYMMLGWEKMMATIKNQETNARSLIGYLIQRVFLCISLTRIKVETRDPKTGEIVRYNADDDNTTLGELLRQEKFGAGSADQKDFDSALARAIATDGGFEDNLDYADDNADRLARKKMRSDAMKRAFAINGK
jgi:hypothetical protein